MVIISKRFCRLKKKRDYRNCGWQRLVKIADSQQHLNYFPARKTNKTETNKSKSVFSKGGLKYFDICLDGLNGY